MRSVNQRAHTRRREKRSRDRRLRASAESLLGAERMVEEFFNRPLAIGFQRAGPGAGEVRVGDERSETRHVGEADIAFLQFFVVEDADTSMAGDRVSFEREIDFFYAVALGARAERRLGALRASAEEDTIASFHRGIIASRMAPPTAPIARQIA